MSDNLSIALIQINLITANFDFNYKKIEASLSLAQKKAIDIIVFPAMSLSAPNVEDLLLREDFIEAEQKAFNRIVELSQNYPDLHLVLGHAQKNNDALYQAVSVVSAGQVRFNHYKHSLSNYGCFDDSRYFNQGHVIQPFQIKGQQFIVAIGDDFWLGKTATEADHLGVKNILLLDASPYRMGQYKERLEWLKQYNQKYKFNIFYTNLIGGFDDLVYDGQAFAIDENCQLVGVMDSFAEGMLILRGNNNVYSFRQALHFDSEKLDALCKTKTGHEIIIHNWAHSVQNKLDKDELQEVWEALVIATRDYLSKNGFKTAALGLSGGIDSAVVLAIIVDAIGAENVTAVMMPSKYTAEISQSDAALMAKNLQVKYHTIAINELHSLYLKTLNPYFDGAPPDTTEENLQARIRGDLLMAFSNKLGCVILPPGNKSELATGYCTLYGDMVGAFAILRDVPKTLVYRLAWWRNRSSEVIPERIITRPPTAELSENQLDQDSLPDYDTLDAIIERLIEFNESKEAIINQGFDPKSVEKVAHLLKINEYKRKQGALGPKITQRAFTRDWRHPVSNGYRF